MKTGRFNKAVSRGYNYNDLKCLALFPDKLIKVTDIYNIVFNTLKGVKDTGEALKGRVLTLMEFKDLLSSIERLLSTSWGTDVDIFISDLIFYIIARIAEDSPAVYNEKQDCIVSAILQKHIDVFLEERWKDWRHSYSITEDMFNIYNEIYNLVYDDVKHSVSKYETLIQLTLSKEVFERLSGECNAE